jgi:hypothetical protein
MGIFSRLVQPGDFNVRTGGELIGMWNLFLFLYRGAEEQSNGKLT